jgi:hypothetical protein
MAHFDRSATILIFLGILMASGLAAGDTGTPSPERDRITLDLPTSKTEAIERAMAAFVAEELIVAKSEGGVISSEPVVVKSLRIAVGSVTYKATVIAISETAARVVLLALYDGPDGPPTPVKSTWKKMFIPHWQRVERMARLVQAEAQHADDSK